VGRQSQLFLQSEGKAWLARNEHKLPLEKDPVLEALTLAKVHPFSVLEVGCANGWRLYEIQDSSEHTIIAAGIDPCIEETISDTNLQLVNGTAENIPFIDKCFDLVIYGFCLYLCDPEDYCRIVAECDRVLATNGHICIYDFFSTKPYARRYEHMPSVYSRKMDFAQLWLGNPSYRLVSRTLIGNGDERTCVAILQKVIAEFPVREQ
jgi:SAM-dependent methyltransferase